MGQKYKVFTEQGGILICDSRKNNLAPKAPNSFFDFLQFSEFVGQNIIEVYAENPKIRYRELFSSFKSIRAAGGLLLYKHELLLIYRNGFWDLPKGHVDQNESIQDAALREVKEECGISGRVQLVDFFQQTYHTYLYKTDSVLKRTDWFIMKCPSKERLIPQIEEGISECRWVPVTEIDHYLGQTFISIRELLIEFIEVNNLNT
tara:strand:- start:1297 stop:1908 length:612 start_codon:yes stop_codon:yes gene_type:complete